MIIKIKIKICVNGQYGHAERTEHFGDHFMHREYGYIVIVNGTCDSYEPHRDLIQSSISTNHGKRNHPSLCTSTCLMDTHHMLE